VRNSNTDLQLSLLLSLAIPTKLLLYGYGIVTQIHQEWMTVLLPEGGSNVILNWPRDGTKLSGEA
jgi:hypothetical protein